MATVNEKGSVLKDSFLTGEIKEMIDNLLATDENTQKLFKKYSKKDSSELFDKAKELIGMAEIGAFSEKEMENVEYMIAILLTALNFEDPEPDLER